MNFISPLDKETAAANALIPSVLLRGCEKYPTMADINKKLDYLYDAGLSSRNQKRGEAQVFGICAGVLDNCYALEGEDLLSEIVGIVGNILLHPVTNGAAFDAAYTESEKNNLIDAINANINNQGVLREEALHRGDVPRRALRSVRERNYRRRSGDNAGIALCPVQIRAEALPDRDILWSVRPMRTDSRRS